ncbi:MAG: polyprenyl synthetase family protein, partial [Oscillospiraceae bacterium]|nr:polyprenyl synthetase family protein [Oscillospiraceae bacterium]
MINRLVSLQKAVDSRLSELFVKDGSYAGLTESMRYSLLAGGKRIRPVLALAFAEACGASVDRALDAACSLELLHTYSLIHDDLPCMDNDSLRRGKPTNHVVYGETTAVLAGDCLQAEAFALLASSSCSAGSITGMIRSLSRAAGLRGICGGQALDIAAEGKEPT